MWDSVPSEELIAAGILPGDWDEPRQATFSFSFDNVIPFSLHNVLVYDELGEEIAFFDSIVSSELELTSFDVPTVGGIRMFASSMPDSEPDLALATGNPFEEGALIVSTESKSIAAFIQMRADNPAGFETFRSVRVTIVPEPSSLSSLAWALGVLTVGTRRCLACSLRKC